MVRPSAVDPTEPVLKYKLERVLWLCFDGVPVNDTRAFEACYRYFGLRFRVLFNLLKQVVLAIGLVTYDQKNEYYFFHTGNYKGLNMKFTLTSTSSEMFCHTICGIVMLKSASLTLNFDFITIFLPFISSVPGKETSLLTP